MHVGCQYFATDPISMSYLQRFGVSHIDVRRSEAPFEEELALDGTLVARGRWADESAVDPDAKLGVHGVARRVHRRHVLTGRGIIGRLQGDAALHLGALRHFRDGAQAPTLAASSLREQAMHAAGWLK